MSALGHVGIGLATKRVAPEISAGVALLAAEGLDVMWGVFALTGIDPITGPFPDCGPAPWSHGLFMAAVWSVVAALVAARVYRRTRSGVIIGALVFSHWALDFLTHPMWPSRVPDLPLLFKGSPLVGLGLYNSAASESIFEFGMPLVGLAIYLHTVISRRRQALAAAGPRQGLD